MYHKIALKIRLFRKNKKWSQELLAEKAGCSREFISRLENNKEKISLKMVFKLSEVFKITPKVFFE